MFLHPHRYVVTLGADVQRDRVEVSRVAWRVA